MRRVRLLVDGRWQEGSEYFPSVNPASGEAIGHAPNSTAEDVRNAVTGAVRAARSWSQTPADARAQVILRFAELLRAEYGQPGELTPMKSLIVEEVGKRLPEADIEVTETADFAQYFATIGPRLLEPIQPTLDAALWPTKRSEISWEPHGVVAVIKAWNYPLEIPAWSILPALVAGNAVVFKPSEHAPFVGERLVQLLVQAGLPPGVLSLLTGSAAVGEQLVRDKRVSFVSFTGSVAAGTDVAGACAQGLVPSSLELGGSDPLIVLEDADLILATNGAAWGRFANCGQVCVAPKRAIVHESVFKPFSDLLAQKVNSLVVGRDVGPVISLQQLETLESQIARSIFMGAKVVVGGKRISKAPFDRGFFFEPTLLVNVRPEMPVFSEETFGPVLPLVSFREEDEALAIANSTDLGLGASIWTQNTERAKRLAARLECGMVWINDVNLAFPQCPWTARKRSGTGVELGESGIRAYTRLKHVNWDVAAESTRAWWFPYPD